MHIYDVESQLKFCGLNPPKYINFNFSKFSYYFFFCRAFGHPKVCQSGQRLNMVGSAFSKLACQETKCRAQISVHVLSFYIY